MISVWINGRQRDGVDEGWIAQTIQGLRHDGESVCVRVNVKGDGLELAVTAGNCPASRGGRPPTSRESAVFDVWSRCSVSADVDFSSGQLIRCLKELERVL
jgi:hypothetical protein